MSNYFIELAVVHIVLISAYWLLLRKESQYQKMRVYLIGATLLSLIIPFFKLPKLFYYQSDTAQALPVEILTLDVAPVTEVSNGPIWSTEWLLWIYIALSCCFLYQFITSIINIYALARKSKATVAGDYHIRNISEGEGSFTFFNWIFLNDKIDHRHESYDMILNHERAHAALGHTYDIILFELFKVGFWWLPSAWFINKEIRKIHEYQADACALKFCSVDQYSSILIRSTLKSNGVNLASSFHDGLILKRIIAMKQKTKNLSPWKIGSLLSVTTLLFIAFACTEELSGSVEKPEIDKVSNDEVFTFVEEQPSYDGGLGAFYRYVASEIRYPLDARNNGIEGIVYVHFDVEKDGSLTNFEIARGIDKECNAEAIRVIKSAGTFTPARQRGKAVRTRMVLPITFTLKEGATNPDNSPQGVIAVEEGKIDPRQFTTDISYNDGVWSGTIYGDRGQTLPGVNVVIEGTSRGTVSDLSGTFSISASKNENLNLSFIGFESVLIPGKANSTE